ncbi:MAG: hypothetical protein AB1716_10605 [Planctomycetota bacterium]
MQFIKSYWISLVSGVVALTGIAVGIFGMTSDSVTKEMERRKQPVNEIASLRSSPQNESTIEAQKKLGQRFTEQHERTLQVAMQVNVRQPLLTEVFPKREQNQPAAPVLPQHNYRFRKLYEDRLAAFPLELEGGGLPTLQELNDEAEIVAEMQKKKAEQEGAEAAEQALRATPQMPMGAPMGGRGAPPMPMGGRGAPPMGGRGAPPMPMGGRGAPPGAGGRMPMAPIAGAAPAAVQATVTEEVQQRAAAKKARAVRIYVTPECFYQSPITASDEAPTPRDMWYAQVALWIEEDLVNAIKRVNAEHATQVDPKDANVTRLPVKRIVNVAMDGYVTSTGAIAPFPTGLGQVGTSLTGPSFTGRKSDDQFDVVRFRLAVVVDRRNLLDLVDAITRSNFYQLVGAEYNTVSAEDAQNGYFYGPAPVVQAALEWEGYLTRHEYKSMMPDAVLQDLGLQTAPAAGNQGT